MADKDLVITKYYYLTVKTKWAVFYTYILIPVYAIVLIVQIILFLRDISYINLYKNNLIVNLSMLVITVPALIFMMKYKKCGYYLNMLLLICQCAAYAYMQSAKAVAFGVVFLENFTFALALWTIPNIVYFYLRKDVYFTGLISKSKINKNARRIIRKDNCLTRCVKLLKIISFNECVNKINSYDISNKFLKFYLFYFMPVVIIIIMTRTYNMQAEKYAAWTLCGINVLSYFFMLKLRRIGIYLNAAFIILSGIYSIYFFSIYSAKYGNLPSELYIACITAQLAVGVLILIYLLKRKEMFETQKVSRGIKLSKYNHILSEEAKTHIGKTDLAPLRYY